MRIPSCIFTSVWPVVRSSLSAQPGQASRAWPGGLASQPGPGQEASRLARPGHGVPGRPTFFLIPEKKQLGPTFFFKPEKKSWAQLFFQVSKKKLAKLAFRAGPESPNGHFAFFGWAGRARKAILRFLDGPAGPGRPFCVFQPFQLFFWPLKKKDFFFQA